MSLTSPYNSNTRFVQSFDGSLDFEDLKNQNRALIQENKALK
jgi:hypothetical protein